MLRAGAAIIKDAGWNNGNRAIMHREWTRRKIDMSWNGNLRDGVTKYLLSPSPAPVPAPTPPAPTPAKPTRRYTMVIYSRRGTVDGYAAQAAHSAAPVGVITQSLSEARAAVERNEKVVAVGGPAVEDLPNAAVKVRGATAADTGIQVFQLAKNGWK
jgi:hypothetical protein